MSTIETEVVNEQALALRDRQEIAPSGLFGQVGPAQVIAKASETATALKEVVSKQGLISKINGKEYPRCEAWTLLGTILGVFPVLNWTRPVEGGWEARVEAKTKTGDVIGAAEAQCLKTERNWSNRDDFALRSMAQTRATAKCLRMPLGFIMTLAGYEATPAEELTSEMEAPQRQHAPSAAKPAAPAKPATEPHKLEDDETQSDCLFVSFNEAFSKEGTPKPWHAFFCKFQDQQGQEFEANTFDEGIGATLKALLNTTVTITYKPSKKPGKWVLTSIEPHEVIP